MVYLNLFPTDILSMVTFYVSAFDICHLIWCGDKRLSTLLFASGVEEFHMIIDEKMPQNGIVRWPNLISHFCGLRTLVIAIDPPYCKTGGPVSHIRLDQLPSSLRQVKFRFIQAETCFFRLPPRLDVVYPHQLSGMKYVELGNYSGSEQEYSDDEGHTDFEGVVQPAPVLNKLLSEKLAQSTKASPPMVINNQKNHPETVWTSAGFFNFRQRLPNLQHLSLEGFSCIQPHQLPYFTTSEKLASLKLTSLASFLNGPSTGNTVLSYYNDPDLIIPTDSFPLSAQLSSIILHRFPTPTELDDLVNMTEMKLEKVEWESHFASLLPRQLETLTIENVPVVPTSDDDEYSPLSCQDVERLRKEWPPSLLHLEVLQEVPLPSSIDFVNTLPRTLKSLSIQPTLEEIIPNRRMLEVLPKSLETLDFSRLSYTYCIDSDLLPSLPSTITSLNVPLLDSDCRLLPPTLLVLSTEIIGTNPDPQRTVVEGLPRSLKKLTIGIHGALSSDFTKRLPQGLRYLYIFSGRIKSSFFDSLPPHLQSLKLPWNQVCHSVLSISKLPSTLLELMAPTDFFYSLGALQLLPRGLLDYEMTTLNAVPLHQAKTLPPSLPIDLRNFTAEEIAKFLDA